MSVMPNTNPPMRLAAIEIPRYLDHEPNYLLHYRFGGGGEFHEGFDHDVTEEIVSREVEYVDNEGLITEVRALWSVGGWRAPNWSQAKLKGLKLNVLERDWRGPRAQGWPTRPSTSWCRPCRCRAASSPEYGVPRGRQWSTPFSFCALIRRRRRATSRGGTIISRRTTAWCFERMRAALNDGTHPLRVLIGRRMLACDVCGWVHYAMTANEKAQSDHALERYNLSASERPRNAGLRRRSLETRQAFSAATWTLVALAPVSTTSV